MPHPPPHRALCAQRHRPARRHARRRRARRRRLRPARACDERAVDGRARQAPPAARPLVSPPPAPPATPDSNGLDDAAASPRAARPAGASRGTGRADRVAARRERTTLRDQGPRLRPGRDCTQAGIAIRPGLHSGRDCDQTGIAIRSGLRSGRDCDQALSRAAGRGLDGKGQSRRGGLVLGQKPSTIRGSGHLLGMAAGWRA